MRRFTKKGGNHNSNKREGGKKQYDLPEGNIPSIPGFILYKIKPEDVRKDLIRWRGIYNDERRTIKFDELQRNLKSESGNDDDKEVETDASQETAKSKRRPASNKNRRVKTVRKTAVRSSGLEAQTIRVSMKDLDDDTDSDDSNGSISSGDDGDPPQDNTVKVRALLRKKETKTRKQQPKRK